MKKSNLAVVPSFEKAEEEPIVKDGDGEESGEGQTFQITIDVAENGYIVTRNAEEEVSQKVFLFDGNEMTGPKAMIETVIFELDLLGKVKVQK